MAEFYTGQPPVEPANANAGAASTPDNQDNSTAKVDFDLGRQIYDSVLNEVTSAVYLTDEQADTMLSVAVNSGSLLLKGYFSTGKTAMAKAMAASYGGEFGRIDGGDEVTSRAVTGLDIYSQETGKYQFMPGPVFAHSLLVDEFDLMPEATQNAFTQVMEEKLVTAQFTGVHELPEQQLILATSNDRERDGIAQRIRARFTAALEIPEPTDDDLAKVHAMVESGAKANPVATLDEMTKLREITKAVALPPKMYELAQMIVREAYQDTAVDQHESIRPGYRHIREIFALARVGAIAGVNDRGERGLQASSRVLPSHIRFGARAVLLDRITPTYAEQSKKEEGKTSAQIIEGAITQSMSTMNAKYPVNKDPDTSI